MKVIGQVVGYSRRKGISSKTGKEYDFAEVHFQYCSDDTIGAKCFCGVMDWTEFEKTFEDVISLVNQGQPFENVSCGIVYHSFNGRMFLDAII